MTVRRKTTESGESFSFDKVSKTLLYAVLISSLSANPVGQQILKLGGISGPAVEQTQTLQNDVKGIKETITELSRDVTSIKANNAIINTKVDRLDQALTGFQVDFQRYKTTGTSAPVQPTVEPK